MQPDDLDIRFLASCARSGETMVLRHLSAHPQIHVPFDLKANDGPQKAQMLAFFKSVEESRVPREVIPQEAWGDAKTKMILVKQGVWEHPHPFKGAVLARNPLSVIASLLAYDHPGMAPVVSRELSAAPKGAEKAAPYWARLLRWQKDIDPSFAPLLLQMDHVEALCAFYTRRMLALVNSGLPVVHYESVVARPEEGFRALLTALELPWHDAVLGADQSYPQGHIGHGNNDLGRPVDMQSLQRHKEILEPKDRDRILGLTWAAWSALGYALDGEGSLTV